MATSNNSWQKKGLRLLGIWIGVGIAVVCMMLAFLAPMMNSGAKDLPLAISGPEQMVQQVEQQLETQSPGSFESIAVADVDVAREKIMNREAVGAIALTPAGIEVLTASAQGTPYKSMFTQLAQGLQSQLQTQGSMIPVNVQDIAPLPADDPQGLGITILALPLAFGGMASGAALSYITRRRILEQFLGVLGVAVLGGLGAVATLSAYGSITAAHLEVAAAFALGLAAISLTVQAFESLLNGLLGIGLVAVFMIFVSNPLSGLSTGPDWLPAPWGVVGQHLPIGATGTLIRNIAFFDSNAIIHPIVTLTIWIIVAIIIMVVMDRLRHRKRV